MRIVRYQHRTGTRNGVVDPDGTLRDAGPAAEGAASGVTAGEIEALSRFAATEGLPLDPRTPLMRPWGSCSKVVCIGLNYRDHAEEAGLQIPSEPIVFLKAPSALSGPDDDIVPPPGASQLDWEVELGVVLGRRASRVEAGEALSFVAGYCVFNDVSERAFQFQSSQWDKGKSADTFGPAGPWLVTPDEVPDPQALRLWLTLNGEPMQDGHTSDMIFSVPEIIAYCSRYMTLLPGDLIVTGTPAGVGMGRDPKVWLRPGDVLELGIDGLGRQRQRVADAS